MTERSPRNEVGVLRPVEIPQHIADEGGGLFDAILHDGTMTAADAWAMLMRDIGPLDEIEQGPHIMEAVLYRQIPRSDYDDQWFEEASDGDIAGWKVAW